MGKIKLNYNVYEAAKDRISFVFDKFEKIYVSFSGGKDSASMIHLVMEEAIKRNRKVGVLTVDLEAQYKLTIDFIQSIYDLYKDYLEPFWVCLPISLRNAVSQYEPKWICWQDDTTWVRQPPQIGITNKNYFDFYTYAMEFEEFTPKFGHWYSDNKLTACFVGIRADESLNRYRTIVSTKKQTFANKQYTTKVSENLYNVYPIYDWTTKDIWIYNSKYKKSYNKLYDLMYKAGLTIHQMRICQPYGDDQRKGLYLYHIIEPETWSKVVSRVSGANQGSLYAQESGNILGRIHITKPKNHTWESFSRLLLYSMPAKLKEHFENKIAVFLHWWKEKGYNKIPDEASHQEEASKKIPSWRRICKALLRNDYWCKGLSFAQHKKGAYENYKKIMKKRRAAWGY